MHSALEHLPADLDVATYVLDNGLTHETRERLRHVVGKSRGREIQWLEASSDALVERWSMPHLTPTTYARLLIPDLLPSGIRRAVYLDGDVLVRKDLTPLFEVNLGMAAFGAVRDYASPPSETESVADPQVNPKPFFNAGVLVIDLPRWRSVKFGDRALSFARSAEDPLPYADQDAMNAVATADDWFELDLRWNVQVLLMYRTDLPNTQLTDRLRRGRAELYRSAAVVHFNGLPKPWEPWSYGTSKGKTLWAWELFRSGSLRPTETLRWLAPWLVRRIADAGRRAWTRYPDSVRKRLGVRDQIKISVSRALRRPSLDRRFSSGVVHLAGSPSLTEIYRRSSVFTISPEEVVEAVLAERAEYIEEYAQVRQRLTTGAADRGNGYPDYWDIEESTAILLYALVRQTQPSLSLEVGVANGRSTQVILSALDANGKGQLVSVDIDPDVGGLARGHARWSLHVHAPGKSSSRQLSHLLEEIGATDLFFHDAGHTYHEQYDDYLAAYEHLRPGGLFVSDDVDMSYAFLDLTRKVNIKPVVLGDRRKVVGVFRRP